ncbi:VOC family protein [Pedococcus sp. 5OH_020]|uniref:VOC family protein n=1 Tax=Pedococcus sp. 5OH_020 TaxID=2989814 RepID=UPI0022E9B794|nr:VOC family protein [Pedococcus sp. 5OH_020]
MPTRDEPWPAGTPSWVDLMVDDVQQAREFYEALFGWEFQQGAPESGGYLTATKDGGAAAGLGAKPEGQGDVPTMWTTYLESQDAEATTSAVTAAGGQVVVPVMDVMGLGRMAVATDPTGAVFGIWQSQTMTGAAVANQDGAYCWNELHTRDYEGSKEFYAAVFGYRYDQMGDGESFAYSTFTAPGQQASCGGINDDTKMPGEHPPYWLVWFQADDVDSSTARATELGGSVMMGPDDTPFGRMTIVRAPQGEVFGLIDPTSTTPAPTPG